MHPDKYALRRLTDELFLTTDAKDWNAARALFADGEIDVDMSSLAGGGPVRLTANALIEGFGDRAEVFAHGYAWNRVPSFPAGQDLWETWGNYRLSARRQGAGWRIDGFRYFSKHTRGNDAVRTHAAGDPPA